MTREPSDHEPRLDTLAIHAGRMEDDPTGSIVTPIYQSATFLYPGAGRELVYTRYGNNPAQRALQVKLAALEGAEAALVLASGMAALATGILTVCGRGDHLLVAPDLYGGTHRLLDEELPRLGVEVTYAPGLEPASWAAAIRPSTRLLLWEAMSNPLLRVADTPALAALARERGVTSLVDATFATPFNLRPIEHGVDLVMHSATKYLGGHDDLIGGVLAGSAARIGQATERMHSFGGSADPHAMFLLDRGLKTLGVRMERHNHNGRAIADFLAGHPGVERVHYPTRPDHPDHDVAARLLAGAGGVVTFVPRGSPADAEAMLRRLRWILLAPSLGGVESLSSMPRQTSHRMMSPDERARRGIDDRMVRLAIGIEAAEDLIADLDQALAPG